MPAKDLYHNAVVNALTKADWIITDDPLKLTYGGQDLYVDLGAEHNTIGAEKSGRKIAVEIKSFLNRSSVRDLEQAVGQYDIYKIVLEVKEPDRILYLAVPQRIYESLFTEKFGRLILENMRLRLIVFEEDQEQILVWIN